MMMEAQLEDAALLALKLEEEATSQRLQAPLETGKTKNKKKNKQQELTDGSRSAIHVSLASSRAEIVPLVGGMPNNRHSTWFVQDNKYLLINTSDSVNSE